MVINIIKQQNQKITIGHCHAERHEIVKRTWQFPPDKINGKPIKVLFTLDNEKKSRMNDQEAEDSNEKSLSLAKFLDLSYFSDLKPFGLRRNQAFWERTLQYHGKYIKKSLRLSSTKRSVDIFSGNWGKREYPDLWGITRDRHGFGLTLGCTLPFGVPIRLTCHTQTYENLVVNVEDYFRLKQAVALTVTAWREMVSLLRVG